ncbi:DNA methylase domain protein [Mycobacterium xenopi 4042]|uniref:DNA methylase domain protein n=1 Tax=Mycobacterium xenopi 4042 TaxID=1299334 RepID=X7YPH5_MYCXE|nr:DNA methylase domain protein [Mycobacterium xenopi 4042]
MIAHQEELDWEYYRIYGLIDNDLTYGGDVPKSLLANGLSRSPWRGA